MTNNHETYKKWIKGLSIVIPFFVYILGDFVYEDICVIPSLLSLSIVLYCLFSLIFFKKAGDLFIFPSLALTWLYFLSPYLNDIKVSHIYRIIPEEKLPIMAWFCCFAIFAIYAGFYRTFRKRKVKSLSLTDYRVSNTQLAFLIKLFLGLSLFFRLGNDFFPKILEALGNTIQLLFYAPTILCSLLVLYFVRNGSSIIIKVISISYLIIEFFYRVAETLYFHVVLLVIGGFVLYFLEKKKLPYKTAIIFLMLTIPLFLTRFDHRYKTVVDRWYGGNNASFIEITTEGITLFSETISNFQIESLFVEKKEDESSSRFENISYLGHCVHKHTDDNMEFKYGETFYWLPIAPIPRFLLPFKPENILSTKVAEQYGLKGSSKGSMNFPILCESYINFGFLGIVLIAFFQGVFLKWSFLKVGGISGDINILIFLNIVKQLISLEGNITLVFGAILQVFLFWYILINFILPKQKIK